MLRRAAAAAATVVVVAVAALLVGAAPTTAAGDPCQQQYVGADGKVHYRNICAGGGESTDPPAGGGGGDGPSCYLGRKGQFNYQVAYCSGELSCYRFIPPPSSPLPDAWPARPPGTSETAQYANQACFTQPPAEELVSNEYIWVEPAEVDPAAFLTQAIGNIALPTYTVGFNPPGRTVVGLPTWFWADGAGAGPVVGSSAGGLVGTATPAHLEVDPGDGSGSFTCAWSVTPSDTCAYSYRRSSARETTRTEKGTPAYPARMRLVLTLSFQFNGGPITLAGAPETISTPWQGTLVPVAEVQTLVTDP